MQIIYFTSLIFIILFAPAAQANPFTAWDKCPQKIEQLNTELAKLESHSSEFSELKEEELHAIVEGKSWKSTYLTHIATYLLPDSLLAGFAKTCWAMFQEAVLNLKAGNVPLAKEKSFAWRNCVQSQFPPAPPEILQIAKCIDELKTTPKAKLAPKPEAEVSPAPLPFLLKPGQYRLVGGTGKCLRGKLELSEEKDYVYIKINNKPLVRFIDAEKLNIQENSCTLTFENANTGQQLTNTLTENCPNKPTITRQTTIKKGENGFSYTIKEGAETYTCELAQVPPRKSVAP